MDIFVQVNLRCELLREQLSKGQITLKEFACQTNLLKLQFNCGVAAIKAEEMASGNTDMFKRLKKRGVISNDCLITHSPDENALTVIDCEQMKKQITREECKTNSGSNKCDWALCEQNDETRALITNRLIGRGPDIEGGTH